MNGLRFKSLLWYCHIERRWRDLCHFNNIFVSFLCLVIYSSEVLSGTLEKERKTVLFNENCWEYSQNKMHAIIKNVLTIFLFSLYSYFYLPSFWKVTCKLVILFFCGSWRERAKKKHCLTTATCLCRVMYKESLTCLVQNLQQADEIVNCKLIVN